MLKRKAKVLALLVLALTLFLTMAQAALAASKEYELDRIDLYDYYNSSSRIRIDEDDIRSKMSETVNWRRVRIVPRTIDGYATLTGEVRQDSDDEYYVTLDENETIRVTINIYDDDDERQTRYTLDLTRGLEGIESVLFTNVGKGEDFEKEFDSLEETNTLLVPKDVEELRVKVYMANDDYTVECNDSSSKNNSWDIDVPTKGKVSVYLNVYNEDDDEVAEYRFDIERSSSASSSHMDLLDKLTVKGESGDKYEMFPAFDESIHDYYICVPRDERYVTLTPDYGSDCYRVKIDGSRVNDGEESDELNSSTGRSSYDMVITDDNDDDEEYSIYIVRAVVEKGSSAGLDDLRIKRGTSKTASSLTEIDSDPSFDEYKTSYELVAGDDSSYFSFRPEIDDTDSIVLLAYGDTVTELEDGSYCTPVKLYDEDVVTIRSYSPNFEEYKDYEFEIVGRKLDDTDTLDKLVLTVDGVKVALTPSFATKTLTYTASVGANAKNYTVTPTADDSSATITVNGDTVKSGRTSDEYKLSTNFTNVSVVVTAESGDSSTYRITIDRNGSGTDTPVSGEPVKVVMRIGNVNYIVNGKTYQLAAAPYINSQRTEVPLRAIAESLGASVFYDSATKQITISKGDERLYMTVGKVISGFGVAPEVKANTTFVPIRYVSEQLHCVCTYNNASQEVVITYNMDDAE